MKVKVKMMGGEGEVREEVNTLVCRDAEINVTVLLSSLSQQYAG